MEFVARFTIIQANATGPGSKINYLSGYVFIVQRGQVSIPLHLYEIKHIVKEYMNAILHKHQQAAIDK